MKEDRYLQIFLTPSELDSIIKKIIMTKLKEKYLDREIDGKIITNIRINNLNNLPLLNNLELNNLANVTYKIYKPGDIINGEIFSNEKDDRVFVLSYDIICEILNIDDFEKIRVNKWLCLFFSTRYYRILLYIIKMIYCGCCDRNISQKFLTKHNKSKTHLYFYNNFVINKYYIGDLLWKDFEKIIRDFINDYNNKFYSFSILINFQLDKENMSISINNIEGEIPLYKNINSGWIYYNLCQSKKVRDFVFHNATLKNIKLESTSIINNVIITIFSKYKTIKKNHSLKQPRSIL